MADWIKTKLEELEALNSVQKVGVIAVGTLFITSPLFTGLTAGLYIESWDWSPSLKMSRVVVWITPMAAALAVIFLFGDKKENEDEE